MTFFVTLLSCTTPTIDTSIDAAEAGDYTLAVSACDAAPGGGMDICRVREGTEISSSWVMIAPYGSSVLGGELDVYYKDIHRQYGVTGAEISVPWKEFFAPVTQWSADMDGEALALLVIRWKDDKGIEQATKFRGIAKLVVTKAGYDRLPIDSGYVGFQAICKVQYSTSGRGAVQCQ